MILKISVFFTKNRNLDYYENQLVILDLGHLISGFFAPYAPEHILLKILSQSQLDLLAFIVVILIDLLFSRTPGLYPTALLICDMVALWWLFACKTTVRL